MRQLFALLALLCASITIHASEVEYQEFEFNLDITALEATNYLSSTNNYKVGIDLVGKSGIALIAPLKGSTSANIYRYFQNSIPLRVDESTTIKGRLVLPTKALESLKIRITVLEANFRIVLPGGPLVLNNDDRVAREAFYIEELQAEVNPLASNTSAALTIRKIGEGFTSFENIIEAQKDLMFLGGGLFGSPDEHLRSVHRSFQHKMGAN